MTRREDFLQRYIDGWRRLDCALVRSTLAEDFRFEDPALPEPVTALTMADYMRSWERRMESESGQWRYCSEDEVRQDRDGILLRWKWWRFAGTGIQGSACTKTSDQGMVYERIAYFCTPPYY